MSTGMSQLGGGTFILKTRALTMPAMEGEPVALRIISEAQQPLDNSYQRRDHCARMCQAIESFRISKGH